MTKKATTVDQIVDKVIEVTRRYPQASNALIKSIAQDETDGSDYDIASVPTVKPTTLVED